MQDWRFSMAPRSSMFSSSAAGMARAVVVAVRARRRVVSESCILKFGKKVVLGLVFLWN